MSPKSVEAVIQTKAKVTGAWVCRVVQKVLRAEKSQMPIQVLVTSDTRIRKINHQFLKHDYATDVISFATGDVVVSAETAGRMARRLGVPYKEELARYLVHGTLHLLGYNDKNAADFNRMHTRQEALLKKIL